jgi:hypothetical protein
MRLRPWFSGLFLLALCSLAAEGQRRCTTGVPCGNTCVAADSVCRATPPTAQSSRRQVLSERTRFAVRDTTAAWVASNRGTMYYRNGCPDAKRIPALSRLYFRTEQDAQKGGFKRSRSRDC